MHKELFIRNIVTFCFVLIGYSNLYAQNMNIDSHPITLVDSNKIYAAIQKKPQFSGDIQKWLLKNTNYPLHAKNNNIQGIVFVSFVVETDGNISHVKILKGINRDLDSEAIRVTSKMPKWIPGMQNGHSVRVEYDVPIRFILPEDGNNSLQFPYDLSDWISEQVNYPVEASKKKIEGEVLVGFTVEKDGSVSHINVQKGIKGGAMMDKEAERIVSVMPLWCPRFQDNKPVSTELTVKIIFRIKRDSISNAQNMNSNLDITVADTDKVFSAVQQMPKFMGDDIGIWLTNHIKYPDEAKNANIQGTVFVSFIVERNGSVSNIKILRGVEGGKMLDNEAIRVVSLMPKWMPGMQDGKPVNVQYMLPIHFAFR